MEKEKVKEGMCMIFFVPSDYPFEGGKFGRSFVHSKGVVKESCTEKVVIAFA